MKCLLKWGHFQNERPATAGVPARVTANCRGSRVILVFDKLRVTSLSGMGSANLASLILTVAALPAWRPDFNESIPSWRLQTSSVHEPWGNSGLTEHSVKGLILAQNERWRHGLGMQVGGIARKGGNRRKGQ